MTYEHIAMLDALLMMSASAEQCTIPHIAIKIITQMDIGGSPLMEQQNLI